MKGKRDGRSGDVTDDHNRYGERSGSFDYGGRDRSAAEKEGGFSVGRPHSPVDIRQVERMREAIIKADERRNFRDYLVVVGAILLAVCVVMTLVLASGINARANRIIENDAIRARAGEQTVTRLENKLDGGLRTVEENGRKLDALTSTTTTTVAPRTTTTRPRTTPTATTRVPAPTTTIRPTTTTTKVLAPATTLPPCRFALLNLCLLS
jgi:hypothetical protein